MWNNQDPDNKNLESLTHEFTLENIKGATILTTPPAATDLKEGELRIVYTEGALYEYTKYGDGLYRKVWTAV